MHQAACPPCHALRRTPVAMPPVSYIPSGSSPQAGKPNLLWAIEVQPEDSVASTAAHPARRPSEGGVPLQHTQRRRPLRAHRALAQGACTRVWVHRCSAWACRRVCSRLLRLRLQAYHCGAVIEDLSQYGEEEECLFPPLTMLKVSPPPSAKSLVAALFAPSCYHAVLPCRVTMPMLPCRHATNGLTNPARRSTGAAPPGHRHRHASRCHEGKPMEGKACCRD